MRVVTARATWSCDDGGYAGRGVVWAREMLVGPTYDWERGKERGVAWRGARRVVSQSSRGICCVALRCVTKSEVAADGC